MSDELRNQLEQLDPMHTGVPVESVTTPSSRARLEQIMNTPLIEQESSDASPEQVGNSSRVRYLKSHSGRRRTWGVLGVAAAAVVAIGGAAIVGNFGGDGDGDLDVASAPLELSLGSGDTMASCMPFDVTILSGMSPAFAATATSVDAGSVTLTVDRWYTGGDAETVVLQTPNSAPSLIAGFDFSVGEHYLITAAEGNVNFCGYSGVATPEMTAAFEAAFPG